MPGALDGIAEGALVLGTDTALAAGLYLGPVGNVAAQPFVVLVVYGLDVLHAEGADPTSGSITTAGTTTRAGAAGRSRAAGLEATGAGPGAGT